MTPQFSFHQSVAIVVLAAGLSAGSLRLDAQENTQPTRPVVSPAPPPPGNTAGQEEQLRRRYGLGPQTSAPAPEYTLEIVEGQLLVANLKGRVDVKKHWGPGEVASVPATLDNIIDVLRDMHPEANLAMAPDLANVKIANLKLRAAALDEELEGLRVASGDKFKWTRPGNLAGAVDPTTGQPLPSAGGQPSLYSLAPDGAARTATARRTVEVFNLAPYLQRKGAAQGAARDRSIEEIEKIILATLVQSTGDDSAANALSYQFHGGASLLIVIGQPEALEVARKVVNALEAEASGSGGFGGGGGGGGAGFDPFMSFGRRVEPSKARQRIVDKLETIQFDSVLYDNLPLAEVIRNLIDEVKRRDAEKKGVNFLVDPNPPPQTAAVAPSIDPTTGLPVPPAPVEALDSGSVLIKINPALTNVRLVDVLDAIVKVADHPIKYSITDYAVVFSLAEGNGPAYGAQSPVAPPGRYGNP